MSLSFTETIVPIVTVASLASSVFALFKFIGERHLASTKKAENELEVIRNLIDTATNSIVAINNDIKIVDDHSGDRLSKNLVVPPGTISRLRDAFNTQKESISKMSTLLDNESINLKNRIYLSEAMDQLGRNSEQLRENIEQLARSEG